MKNPKDIFDNPDSFWDLLTASEDVKVEGQTLDRKQVPSGKQGQVQHSELDRFIDQVIETVSAFANANHQGGLLVVGISKDGQVTGIDHLDEKQRARITDFSGKLRNEACRSKCHVWNGPTGSRQILLLYVPYSRHAICETANNDRRSWVRSDQQNLLLTPERRQAIERDKRIVDFENIHSQPFHEEDIDLDLLKQFRESYPHDTAIYQYGTEEFLRKVGAVERDHQKGLHLTNAGLLFFGKNPQARFAQAYIRLMKFDGRHDEAVSLPTLDQKYDGPLTVQLRDIRAFIQKSGFFKTYQRRSETGGFKEEPELPYIAVDEAIVNAVGHRDYAVGEAIQVRLYRDALMVQNPGRVTQIGHDVPDTFTLDQTELDSSARNTKIMEWMRTMRDADGKAFVQLLSEGTKRINSEMLSLGLPPPEFRLTPFRSRLVLFSLAEEREAKYRREAITTTEFANLYPLRMDVKGLGESERRDLMKTINLALINRLKSLGWFVDSFRYGRITIHQRNAAIRLPPGTQRFVRIYPAYVLQIKRFFGRFYMCIDYDVQVKNSMRVRDLAQHLNLTELEQRRALVNIDEWRDAKIIHADVENCRVLLFDSEQEEVVPSNQVYPSLPTWRISQLLAENNIPADLSRLVKETSLSLKPRAARLRADKTNTALRQLARTAFPLSVDTRSIGIEEKPMLLPRRALRSGDLVLETLEEPLVRFDHQRESKDIREGITKFGAYEETERTIELVPVCTTAVSELMRSLIERIRNGSFKFKGTERTFKTRLQYSTIITAPDEVSIVDEIRRLLIERPEWRGDPSLKRLFLVYTPRLNYADDDESAPYYKAKRLLLEAGIPCQMVNEPTLANPDWKDLNLALNIVAKCGVTPWVLPDAIPDADFFVGLSYTQRGERGSEKYLGYANVFNQFGRWEFYSGSGDTFPYAERGQRFTELVQVTLERLSAKHALQPSPSIAFHYSAKFSMEDRAAILKGARAVRPDGRYSFVWINTHHIMRFYDQKPETDGSLQRGAFVVTSPHQLYISTTGFNPYRKSMGTPLVLEANVSVEGPENTAPPTVDHKAIANQILSLTKLNWASTDSLCGEPITTKYAGDIAYLTAAFLRQNSSFKLHPILESAPWFL